MTNSTENNIPEGLSGLLILSGILTAVFTVFCLTYLPSEKPGENHSYTDTLKADGYVLNEGARK